MPAVPPIAVLTAVLTRTCRLDWLTREATAAVADVVPAGDATANLRRTLAVLAEHDAENVLAEGEREIHGQLAATGLLDEVCLTVSPVVAGGGAGRITRRAELAVPAALALKSVQEADGYLFPRDLAR